MSPLQHDVPLREKTTLRIGGNAAWYTEPVTIDEVKSGIAFAREQSLPVLVIGRGSNLLVSDAGWGGLVMNISAAMNFLEWRGSEVTAQAGALLDAVTREAIERGLCGLEELSGIPGSVGGAVAMNAGAYGTCVADTITSVTALDMSNYRIVTLEKDALGFGYRTSALQNAGMIALAAVFCLAAGDARALEKRRREILEKRSRSQPLDLPNCGSVFKRPAANAAPPGALIEEAGLKGATCGKAQISEKHANFIVNRGGATAEDVRRLIGRAQKAVYEKSGILLKPEVIFAGEFTVPLFEPAK